MKKDKLRCPICDSKKIAYILLKLHYDINDPLKCEGYFGYKYLSSPNKTIKKNFSGRFEFGCYKCGYEFGHTIFTMIEFIIIFILAFLLVFGLYFWLFL